MSIPFKTAARFSQAAGAGRAKQVGLAFVFLWFFIGGIAHFVAADAEAKIIPPYIPWPHQVVFVSGVFEILGALGLLWSKTRRLAGMGLFLLTIAVTPANVYMFQQAELFPVPYWLLLLRLPLQVELLLIIWLSTIRRATSATVSPVE